MKVFIIAGEPSGDFLGASLMRGLSSFKKAIQYVGIGGDLMKSEGLSSLFPMNEIAVMGISEILANYMSLRARMKEAAKAVLEEKPDVLITIDLPEFNLRVAEIVKKKSSIPIVHYVAPSVWAWRPNRAQKMAQSVDHVLALFPFDLPYMREAGMSCDFVGHPIAHQNMVTDTDVTLFKAEYNLKAGPVLVCLPGSRHSEIKRLTPIFGKALAQVKSIHPEVQIVVPLAPNVASEVTALIADWPFEVALIDPRDTSVSVAQRYKYAAFYCSDVALAASGTVSLELAAYSVPMVIGYDMGWLSRQIIGRMVKTDTVTLVNLVSETRHVPEFIGSDCRPDELSLAVLDTLRQPQDQLKSMYDTMVRLGKNDESPGIKAARSVVQFLYE